jgi:hypothetical protein
MDKNAPSDFTHAFQDLIAAARKKQVPLEFLVMNLEIFKTELANQFINQQAAMRAQKIIETNPRIDGQK